MKTLYHDPPAVPRARKGGVRRQLGVVTLTAGLLLGGGVAVREMTPSSASAAVSPAVVRTVPSTPDRLDYSQKFKLPAPRTAFGYSRMFNRVSVKEWGGADVSISTALPDGRRVWLFGDTMSINNGFVHSTAIVQSGGALHVSKGGAQLLPDDASNEPGYKAVYWVEAVRSLGGNRIGITAMPMAVGTASAWDFHRRRAESRFGTAVVTRGGDVVFESWKSWVAPTAMPNSGQDFKQIGPHHFTYQEYVHDIRLLGGGYLLTVNQNWDDGLDAHRNWRGQVKYKDWRPMFRRYRHAAGPSWRYILDGKG